MLRIFALSLCLLATLVSCATSESPSKNKSEKTRPELESEKSDHAYADYLAGHYALNSNDWGLAKDYFDQGMQREEIAADLFAQRAVQTALAVGNVERAAKISQNQIAAGDAPHSLRVIVAADKMSNNQRFSLDLLPVGEAKQLNGLAVGALGGWNAYRNGNKELALRYFEEALAPPQVLWAKHYQQAVFHERERNLIKATLAYKNLETAAKNAIQPALALGGFYERQGQYDEAVNVYENYAGQTRAATLVQQALERAKAKKRPPAIPSPRQTSALGVLASAYGFIGRLNPQLIAQYCALAYHIDPNRHEALVLLGTIADASDRPQDALHFLEQVPNTSAYWPETVEQMIWIKARNDQLADAIKMAMRYNQVAQNHDSATLLGDLYRRDKQYDKAVGYYDIALPEESMSDSDAWTILFSRGVTFDLMKSWERAEADLLRALALAPNQPEILNYLGYTWVDKKIDIEKGMEYIEKAVRLRPSSGQIVDSLGWAEYRIGRYKDAVKTLERATSLEPGDPTINAHLGDAYAKVGRLREAVYQWEKALMLSPDKELEGDLIQKLQTTTVP